MSSDARALQLLRHFSHEIAHPPAPTRSQRVSFGTAWVRLMQPHAELHPLIARRSVSRQDVLDLASGQQSQTATFVAVMAWGYGNSGLGIANTCQATADRQLGPNLSACTLRPENGNITQAYDALSDIKGLGPTFLTKVLYFFGGVEGDFPLILDSCVLRSLAALYGTLIDRYASISYETIYDSAGYLNYVGVMHDWARALNVKADDIEYFLWRSAKGQTELFAHARHSYEGLLFP